MPDSPLTHSIPAPGGVKLHCLEWKACADEAPVVFLHGGGAHAHWWTHLINGLAYRGPRFALDFRGHGDSDFPEEREVGAFNVDLEAMLDWLGREDVHLIGHSMGAAVAFDHASRFDATRSVVLIDMARGSQRGSGRRARLALALRRTYATRQEAVERFRFLPESSHADEALRLAIARKSIRQEPDERFGYKFDPAWFGLPSRPRPATRTSAPTSTASSARRVGAQARRELGRLGAATGRRRRVNWARRTGLRVRLLRRRRWRQRRCRRRSWHRRPWR